MLQKRDEESVFASALCLASWTSYAGTPSPSGLMSYRTGPGVAPVSWLGRNILALPSPPRTSSSRMGWSITVSQADQVTRGSVSLPRSTVGVSGLWELSAQCWCLLADGPQSKVRALPSPLTSSSNSPATSSHLPSLLPSALYQPLPLPPEPAIVSPSHLHSTLAILLDLEQGVREVRQAEVDL
ncbi:hypothetical protein EYF80_018911 [Liparis tanakae]|uniref:Uncharacterized protein n=1 Tax=Liparis tanakae TaxID=230148 RepID=A0A4Z2HYL0_9TELE|nr:hypothetical protein EYF80_018911 [Liparis tanakae]